MDPDERIRVLQAKLAEMRKVYQQLKQEVSSIDRKRKRAKRREQEGIHFNVAWCFTEVKVGGFICKVNAKTSLTKRYRYRRKLVLVFTSYLAD